MGQLRSLGPRIDKCNERYWAIDKYERIDHDLRPEHAPGYDGTHVMAAVELSLNRAFREGFPVAYDRLYGAQASMFGRRIYLDEVEEPQATVNTPLELFEILDAEISELEARLDRAEEASRPPEA